MISARIRQIRPTHSFNHASHTACLRMGLQTFPSGCFPRQPLVARYPEYSNAIHRGGYWGPAGPLRICDNSHSHIAAGPPLSVLEALAWPRMAHTCTRSRPAYQVGMARDIYAHAGLAAANHRCSLQTPQLVPPKRPTLHVNPGMYDLFGPGTGTGEVISWKREHTICDSHRRRQGQGRSRSRSRAGAGVAQMY